MPNTNFDGLQEPVTDVVDAEVEVAEADKSDKCQIDMLRWSFDDLGNFIESNE